MTYYIPLLALGVVLIFTGLWVLSKPSAKLSKVKVGDVFGITIRDRDKPFVALITVTGIEGDKATTHYKTLLHDGRVLDYDSDFQLSDTPPIYRKLNE